MGRIVKARLLSPFVSQTLRPFVSLPNGEDLVALRELMTNGKVKLVTDREPSPRPLLEDEVRFGST